MADLVEEETKDTEQQESIAEEKVESEKKGIFDVLIFTISPDLFHGSNEKRSNKKRGVILFGVILALFAGFCILYFVVIMPMSRYSMAEKLVLNQEYDKAHDAYISLGDYKDSADRALDVLYQKGEYLMEQKRYSEARVCFNTLGSYLDSAQKKEYCANEDTYEKGRKAYDSGDYERAEKYFDSLNGYADSHEWYQKSRYEKAVELRLQGSYDEAEQIFRNLANESYGDAADQVYETKIKIVESALQEGNYRKVMNLQDELRSYEDAEDRIKELAYQYAKQFLRTQEYEKGYNIVTIAEGYAEDYEDVYYETLYEYAKTLAKKGNLQNEETYQLWQQLAAMDYKDSKKLADKYYAWQVEDLFFVVNETNVRTTSFSKYDPVYFEFSLTGPLEGKTDVYVQAVYPSGGKSSLIPVNLGRESYRMGWANGIYTDASLGVSGTLTVNIYDLSMNLMRSESVSITN